MLESECAVAAHHTFHKYTRTGPEYTTTYTTQPAPVSSLSWCCCSSSELELGMQLTQRCSWGGLELKPKPKRHRRREPTVTGTPSPARVCLAGGRFVWYPAHERSTCHQVPSSRRLWQDQGKASEGGLPGYQVT